MFLDTLTLFASFFHFTLSYIFVWLFFLFCSILLLQGVWIYIVVLCIDLKTKVSYILPLHIVTTYISYKKKGEENEIYRETVHSQYVVKVLLKWIKYKHTYTWKYRKILWNCYTNKLLKLLLTLRFVEELHFRRFFPIILWIVSTIKGVHIYMCVYMWKLYSFPFIFILFYILFNKYDSVVKT